MRILVNATTCTVGGGAQVAANFIDFANQDPRHEFIFAISREVERHLTGIGCRQTFLKYDATPSRFGSGLHVRAELNAAVTRFGPDLVFTIFGPAYQPFSVPHVCGFANAWVTHPSAIAYETLKPLERIKSKLLRYYRKLWLSAHDFYWTETEVSRQGLALIANIDPLRIRVIPNSHSSQFYAYNSDITSVQGQLRVLVIGSPYVHKRFPFVAEVAAELKKRGWNNRIKFAVTLPEKGREISRFWDRVSALDVAEMIDNVGILSIDQCPAQYALANCVFLPTVLETFSVSYLEAMVARRPIITSDLDFARDICAGAAEYFEARSPESAATALLAVLLDPVRSECLSQAGSARAESFPSPKEKYEMHIAWLEDVKSLAPRGRTV